MIKRRVVLSLDRDLRLLLFLWRWKLATTKALHARFFARSTLRWAYKRLWKIASAGYITSVPVELANGTAWTLTKQGFLAVRDQLPVLREDGFKSESLYHDMVCAAFHLGDWVAGQPTSVSVFPEQQLRRYELESYPSWIPKTTAHRPDGYTMVANGHDNRVFAIEVEISPKPIAVYQSLSSFYANHRNIDRVMWLVNRASFAEHLHSHLAAYDSQGAQLHNFIALGQFLKMGWSSPVVLGPDLGLTIREVYGGKKDGRTLAESRDTSAALLFLDARKSYVRKSACATA
jgi:hypothetical protein